MTIFCRKGLIIKKEDGKEIVLEEGKEAVFSARDIVKFSLDKFHYKVEDKPEKDEDATDSDEDSGVVQVAKKRKLSPKTCSTPR